jgi:foldase protein PrsA
VVSAGLVLGAAACGSGDPYAAKVDGLVISQKQLEDEMRSIAANDAYIKKVEETTQVRGTGAGDFDVAFTGKVLGQQIQYALVDREIDKRKIKIGPADRQAARTEVVTQAGGEDIFKDFPAAYQDTLVDRAAKVDRLTLSLAGPTSGDDAAKAYYDAHKDEFTEACVSHILVTTKEKADQVKAKIAAGADFETVARTDSRDTGSAAQGGDLGCKINSESFNVPEFIKAMLSQPIGQVGDPVQTQYGFHLIKVRSRTVPPFDQVADQAREKLVRASKAKLQEWINTTVAKAKIVVNGKYGTFNKQTYAVDPPATTTTVARTTTPPPSGIVPLPSKP